MRLAVVALLLVALPRIVVAQTPPPRDSAVALPGMTVTATRSAAPIITTPLAVSKITAPELRGVSGFGVDEVLSKVPGLIAQSRYGTSDVRLMIRGYGSRGAGDRSNSGTSRGVRVLIDGFPETEPDGRTTLDQLDLATAEAVEVIRSNASSLYGNAAGGVVNVITAPSALTPVYEAQPMFGSFGLARYATRMSTPISNGNGVLYANFTNTSFEGWREHSSSRRALVNGGALGRIGDRTQLGFHLTATNNLMHIPGPLTPAQVDEDPDQANPTYLTRNERRYNRIGRLGVTVQHDLDASTSLSSMLYVNPKYLQRSERNTFRDFTRYHVGGNLLGRKSFGSGASHHQFTLGIDEAYQDGAILFYTLSTETNRGTTLTDNKGEGANNFGAFIQDEFKVSERLGLLLGARYDKIAYNYRSFLPNPPVRADSKKFSRVTPKVGVNWLLTPTQSLYANVGGGIEVPAGNETDPTPGAPPALLNPLLEPISSTSIEIGTKSRPAMGDRSVTLGYDVAVYNIDVTNEIVPYNGGRYYLTAASAQRRGVELGLDAQTRAGFFATAAVTLTNNKYDEYVVDSAVIFPDDPTKQGQTADYSDNRIVGLPDMSANVEVGTMLGKNLRIRFGVERFGDYVADDANTVEVPSYTIFNISADLRQPIVATNGWGLRGFVSVRNLTDKHYIGSAFLNPDLVNGAPAVFEPGMPRAVIVSLSLGRMR
jgi:iron complex outermembrane recepter protein